MIRRWLGPVAVAAVLGVIAWRTIMLAMPDLLIGLAAHRLSDTGGVNHFNQEPPATAASPAVVRPSPDLLTSSCPFDLSNGPLLIDATPVSAPYWSLSIFDSHNDVAFVRNGEQAAYQPFKVAVARAGQAVPGDYETVRVDGYRGIAIIRILIDVPARSRAIEAARRATTCRAADPQS